MPDSSSTPDIHLGNFTKKSQKQAINRTKMIFDCKGNVTVYTEENPDFKKAI